MQQLRYVANASNFAKIPGSPIAYWVGIKIFEIYSSCRLLGNLADVRHGLSTGKMSGLFVSGTRSIVIKSIYLLKIVQTYLNLKVNGFPIIKGAIIENGTEIQNMSYGMILKGKRKWQCCLDIGMTAKIDILKKE